jgi:hypothetical protein
MPSTIPESDFEDMEGNMDFNNKGKYIYDIKFEVVVKEIIGTIPGKTSLIKSLITLKNAKRKNETLDFYDTNGIQISPDLKGIEHDEIEGRFCMENGGPNESILYFACNIHTTIPFSTIKGRTIEDFRKSNTYLKIHRGGFKYGVNWSPLGFLLKHHPNFVDNESIKNNLLTKIGKSWNEDNDFFDDEQKKKFIRIIDNESTLETFDPTSIPFEIIHTTVFAKNMHNEKIRTTAVIVTIPYQFYKVGISLMDYLVLSTEKITNYVPLGYKKEEPEKFYDIVYQHATWINECRNIAIINIPTKEDYNKIRDDTSGDTLKKTLHNVKGIDNVAYNHRRGQLNVMVPAKQLASVTKSIKGLLQSTSYRTFKPTLAKRLNPTGSLGSSTTGTSKYSAAMSKYQLTKSPNSSIDTSNAEVSRITGQTGFSWNSQRRIPKVIDFTDNTEFPQLTPTKQTTNNLNDNTSESPANDGSITDTTFIQKAIDSALKKAYEDHRREIEYLQQQFTRQLEQMKLTQSSTSLETKFDKKFEELKDMMLMMNTERMTTMEPSPIRKKGRPTNLEEQFFQKEMTTRSSIYEKTTKNNERSDHTNHDETTEEEMPDTNESEQLTPQKPYTLTSANNSNQQNEMDVSYDSESSYEGEWITAKEKPKYRKDKKPMSQPKISDMMNKTTKSPPRNEKSNQNDRNTILQSSRSTPPRPIQAEKYHRPNVILTTLSSSRGGTRKPHGREN